MLHCELENIIINLKIPILYDLRSAEQFEPYNTAMQREKFKMSRDKFKFPVNKTLLKITDANFERHFCDLLFHCQLRLLIK